jgi:hypothetical protein
MFQFDADPLWLSLEESAIAVTTSAGLARQLPVGSCWFSAEICQFAAGRFDSGSASQRRRAGGAPFETFGGRWSRLTGEIARSNVDELRVFSVLPAFSDGGVAS